MHLLTVMITLAFNQSEMMMLMIMMIGIGVKPPPLRRRRWRSPRQPRPRCRHRAAPRAALRRSRLRDPDLELPLVFGKQSPSTGSPPGLVEAGVSGLSAGPSAGASPLESAGVEPIWMEQARGVHPCVCFSSLGPCELPPPPFGTMPTTMSTLHFVMGAIGLPRGLPIPPSEASTSLQTRQPICEIAVKRPVFENPRL